MAISAGTIEALLRLRDEMTPALTRVGRSTQQLGSTMQGAGRAMLPFSIALGAAGVAALKFSTDLNKGMADVATLIPDNVTRVEELKFEVQELAKAHGKSTQDLVGGLYQTISAFGDDAAETVRILEINSKAATAGVATTTDAINLTSAVTKGYGDATADAVQKASDLAFITVKLGQTTFPELAASIGRVIPVAATLGVAQEEMFAGFATLTGVTGGAAEVSTQMAAILRAMLKPTDEMAKAIAGLGFESSEAMISQLGLVGSLDALINSTDGSTESVAALFGRAEALNAVFALTGGQADTFNEKLAAMQEAAGATDTAFRQQTEGINAAGFKWKQFKATAEVVAQRLGDAMVPAFEALIGLLESIVPHIEAAVTWFGNLPQPMQTAAVAFGALLVVIPPLIIILGSLVSSVGAIIAAGPALLGFLTGALALFGKLTVVLIGAAPLLGTIAAAGAAFAGAFALTTWLVNNTEAGRALTEGLANLINKIRGVNTAALEASQANLGEAVFAGVRFQEGESQADFTARIQAHNAEMAKLRGTVEKTAAATGKQAEQVEVLTTAFKGTSEPMRTMADRVRDATEALKEAKLDEQARFMADFAVNGAKLGEIPTLDDLAASMRDIAASTGEIDMAGAFPPEVIGGLPTLEDAAAKAAAEIERLRGEAASAEAVARELGETGNFTAEEIRRVTGVTLKAADASTAWTTELRGTVAGLADLIPGLDGLAVKVGGWLDGLSTSVSGKMSGLFGQGGILSSVMSSGVGFLFGPGGPLMSLASQGLTALQGLIAQGLGKLGEAIKGLFGGPSGEELEGRDLVAGFEDAIIATLDATQQAESGGERWKQVVIGVRDAYIAAGRTAAEAEAAVERLWKSSKEGPEATQAAIAEIEAVAGDALFAAEGAAEAAGASTDALAQGLAEMDPEALAATTEAAEGAAAATTSAAEGLNSMAAGAETATTSVMALTEAVRSYTAAALGVPTSITLPTPSGTDQLPSFDVGGIVPRDMIASIHRGEVIVPPGEPRRSEVMREAGLGGVRDVSVSLSLSGVNIQGSGDPRQMENALAEAVRRGSGSGRLRDVIRDEIREALKRQ